MIHGKYLLSYKIVQDKMHPVFSGVCVTLHDHSGPYINLVKTGLRNS